MATIEERTKEIDELYAKATAEDTQDKLHEVWELALKTKEELRDQPLGVIARVILSGFWARYYEVRKFIPTETNIDNLYGMVKQYLEGMNKKDVELVANYKYLLSMITGELRKDLEEAGKLNREIDQLVRNTGNVQIGLKVINSQGLAAMRRKDWLEAIAIFTKAEQRYPEASRISDYRQHLGNTVNNRGLSKLHLSETITTPELKKETIRSAIWDLLTALNLYFMVPVIPQKHLEGIRNRLQLAKDKAKEVDPDLVRAIEIFI